jgi:integrase
VTTAHVVQFLDHVLQAASITTRNNYLIYLKALFGVMVARGELAANPASGIKPLRTSATRHTVFTPDQRDKLWAWLKVHEPELYLLTRCIYYTFVRPAELMHLRWQDIDLKRSTILIAGEHSKNHKTQAVRIPPALHMDFQAIADRHQPYVFSMHLQPGARPGNRKHASDLHLQVLRRFGLDGLGHDLYSWKHTGVCMAYKAGVDIKTLQTQLRHSDLATTDKYLRGLGVLVDDNILRTEW